MKNNIMTPQEYIKLLEYIQDNNGWKNSYQRNNLGEVPLIKYVTSNYDTRDGEIWCIIIRDGHRGSKIFTGSDLNKENIIRYLNGKESNYVLVDN